MKKQMEQVLPDYERKKLLTYADSIRELAVNLKDTQNFIEEGNKEENRREYACQRKIVENRSVMIEHLKEMANMLSGLAKECRAYIPVSARRYRQISHALKEVGIELSDFYLIENETGRKEITIKVRIKHQSPFSTEEIGDLLSVLLGVSMKSSQRNRFFLTEEWETLCYIEEAPFHVLTGAAKAVKETETLSGDNYSIFEVENGNLTMILSDGMGSGDKACNDSTMVVELMQHFLEAGFLAETAIQMVNSVSDMSTLDVCSVDLYHAECRFLKVGSACSYIKRQHLVERISAENLPLGVFGEVDIERNSRELMDDDYIIMITDGVLDALSQGIGEDMLSEFIGDLEMDNPNEIANAILRFCIRECKGHIRDDVTVLVMGIWKKTE